MTATQITMRNVKRSAAVARRIREKCAYLERFHPDIRYCRVTVEQAPGHGGVVHPLVITLRVGVPGTEVIASASHPIDLQIALRDAFIAIERQLKDAASVLRREVKFHSLPTVEAVHEN